MVVDDTGAVGEAGRMGKGAVNASLLDVIGELGCDAIGSG